MKRYTSILKKFFVVLPSIGLFLAPNNAWAGSQIYDGQDTCTTTNCNAIVFNGQPLRNQEGQSQPFILQVFSGGNECMRLDVTFQEQDMEAVLVSPSGTVWRNDDGGGNQRPLIKANTDVNGWYTLQINRYDGVGPVTIDGFTLAYGLYNRGNPNCASPTTPLTSPNAPK